MVRSKLNRAYDDTRGELAPLALLSQSFSGRRVDGSEVNAAKGKMIQACAAKGCKGDNQELQSRDSFNAPKGMEFEGVQGDSTLLETILTSSSVNEHFLEEIQVMRKENLSSSVLSLWHQIDELDYAITYWEMINGKRREGLPPRSELYERLYLNLSLDLNHLARIAEFDQYLSSLESNALLWSERDKSCAKKRLTELRTEQYVLQDTIKGECIRGIINPAQWWTEGKGDNVIEDILPFSSSDFAFRYPTEDWFTPSSMARCVAALRNMDEKEGKENVIDFRDPLCIKRFIQYALELQDYTEKKGEICAEMVVKALKWFQYFVDRCHFSPEEELILQFKMQKKSNKDIMAALSERGLTPYKENYISTVYTKRVIGAIAAQAQECQRMVEYITMGRKVFKCCSVCGNLIPRNSIYFNQKGNTKDGFFSYCKDCRKRKKEEKAKVIEGI